MTKKIASVVATLALALSMFAAQPETRVYVERDSALSLDIYMPPAPKAKNMCLFYTYGGGFIGGSRRADYIVKQCQQFADSGFVVVAIDYRLGLKGVHEKNVLKMIKPVDNAVDMASDDLLTAVGYIIEHCQEFAIDTARIILCGGSSGAISSLQADYKLSHRMGAARNLPDDFRFAGVIAFSGAVYSHEGKVTYPRPPAPTMLLHGMNDKLVTYKKIQVGKLGFFGTDALVKRFDKFDFPYWCVRYEHLGHEVAGIQPRLAGDVMRFVEEFVEQGSHIRRDEKRNDPSIQCAPWSTQTPAQMLREGLPTSM